MKILVRTDDAKFTFRFPTFALPLVLRIAARTSVIDKSEKAVCRELARAFHGIKRRYRGLELVHVIDSDGDEVIITL